MGSRFRAPFLTIIAIWFIYYHQLQHLHSISSQYKLHLFFEQHEIEQIAAARCYGTVQQSTRILARDWLGVHMHSRTVLHDLVRMLAETEQTYVYGRRFLTSIILSSNNIQNGNILVSANPGPPGKWPLKRRERERERERLC